MWLKRVLNDKKYYGSGSVMKKLILYFFVAMVFPLPSFAEERNTLWGDFFFDMKRKHAVRLLSEKCGKVTLEGKVRVNIQASECKFASKPFDEIETSVSLFFGPAIFKNNKRLKYLVFNFDDYNREQLEKLYTYSQYKWNIWRKWHCYPPRDSKLIDAKIQSCGASFDNGKVHLRNNIIQYKGNKAGAAFQDMRITQMHFYKNGSELFGKNGSPHT